MLDCNSEQVRLNVVGLFPRNLTSEHSRAVLPGKPCVSSLKGLDFILFSLPSTTAPPTCWAILWSRPSALSSLRFLRLCLRKRLPCSRKKLLRLCGAWERHQRTEASTFVNC